MSDFGNETRTWSLKPQVTSKAEAAFETFSLASPNSASSGLVVRCTQCVQPFEITVDADLNKLPCPICGRTISLTGMAPDTGKPAVISRIAHFELLERVGVGGFGTVWKARDTQLERVVALKIPRQGRLAADSIDEFMREARIAAKLTHPNIASIHEIGRDGNLTYVVTEFMPGMSLAHWADAHELTHREIAELGIKILNALNYAHEMGVVHRDLKPHNVLMDENGEPHITDFGLAKHGKLDFAKSRDGRILGTPAYISPEQASGAAHTADGRADVYSFGVMLFQLLTDTLPFQGTARVLINKALTEEPPRPSTLDSSIPADLETICLKCLEKSPHKRYPTAGVVADELRRFLANEPIHARRISNAARFWRWCRRNPVIPVLFGSLVAVVLLVYISGWFLYETANRQAEKLLTRQSLRGIEFATESVANAATRELEGWYDLLEQLARTQRLRDALTELRTDESVRPIIEELNQPEVGEQRRNELRQLLLASPAHQQMQELLQDVHDRTAGVFGWFVLESDGLQVARWPLNDTVGVNYGWRTYFHGEDRDYPDVASYRSSPRRRLRETHLSAAFISQVTDRWVISVSTPVFGPVQEDGPGEFLGVIALLFELGQITNLPGEASASEFATLIETRADRAGAILQHPLYEKLRSPSRRLPDQLQQLRVDLDQWRAIPGSRVATSDHYRDPVASDPLGTAFDHRWLAAKAPVFVRGDETGLWIVVQERYDQSIGNALSHLRSQSRGVAVASMSLIIVLVIPLWAIALRRLR